MIEEPWSEFGERRPESVGRRCRFRPSVGVSNKPTDMREEFPVDGFASVLSSHERDLIPSSSLLGADSGTRRRNAWSGLMGYGSRRRLLAVGKCL